MISLVRRPLPGICLILLAGFAVYFNSFQVPFILDDYFWIETNNVIRNLGNFFFRTDGYDFSPPRYVVVLSFAINYYFSGLEVAGYHLVNLAIHLGNALLIFALLRMTLHTPVFSETRVGQDFPTPGSALPLLSFVPLFAALLFVAHPVQTQAVTYIVQRMASLATLFYLASAVLYVKARLALANSPPAPAGTGSAKRSKRIFLLLLAGSVISAVLAMKTKEVAFTLPLAVALYEAAFFRGFWTRRLLYLLPLLATLPIIPWGILQQGNFASLFVDTGDASSDIVAGIGDQFRAQGSMSRMDYLLTQFRVIVTYLRLLVWPVQQNLDYDYPLYRTFFTPSVWLSFLLLTTVFAFAVVLFWRSRPAQPGRSQNKAVLRLIAFGICWFFLTLSVESSIIPIADVMAEHRLYLPFFGAAVVFATAFCWLAGKSTRPAVGKGLFLVATVMILSLGGTTWQRNLVWGNEVGLWLDVVAKSPEKPRPYNNLGHALNKAGRPWEAIPYFQRALEIAPYYSDALYNLGRTYLTVNQPAAAIPYLKRVIRIKPDDIKAYNDLGAALNGAGRYAEAAEFLEQNLSRFDSVPEIHFNLGVSYLYLGRQAEARRRLERLSRLDPQLAAQFDSLLRKGI